MSDENNYKPRLLIILLLSILASIFMILFTIPKANALVVKDPDTTKTINNETYYGYYMPTRMTGIEGQSYVDIGLQEPSLTFRSLNSYYFLKSESNNFNYDPLDNYLSSHSINLNIDRYYFTNPINLGLENNVRLMNLTFSIHPGIASDSQDMFSTGNYFYYNGLYDYSFYIVLFSENGQLGSYHVEGGGYTSNYNGLLGGTLSCTTCGDLTIADLHITDNGINGYGNIPNYQVIYKDSWVQVIKINAKNFKFSETLTQLQNSYSNTIFTGTLDSNIFYNNNIITSSIYPYNEPSSGVKPVKLFISQPFDITFYTTNNHVFCSGVECETQENVDNNSDSHENQIQEDNSNFVSDFLTGISSLLNNDYGFSGIVNVTFNFIKNILNTFYNHFGPPTCYSVKVTFFNKDIVLPCGSSFWSRSDIYAFVVIYQSIFTGAICYLLSWKIYKDIINIYNPQSKLIDKSEVDSL